MAAYLTITNLAVFAGGVVVGHLFAQKVIDLAKTIWSGIRNAL